MNKTITKIIGILLPYLLGMGGIVLAKDVLIFEADHQNRIVIHGDTGENKSLYFGDSLSQALHWDDANNFFLFTDDVSFANHEIKNVRLENLSSAPTCNASVVGKIYYNTANNAPYTCDGTNWQKVGTDIENSVVKQSLVGFAGGAVLENGSTTYLFNSTVTRTATGRYRVSFNTPHPNGNGYSIALSVQEDSPNRDNRKIQWLNKSSTGFDVSITFDDNGGTADTYGDERFDFTVFEIEDIIVSQP